VDSFYEDLEAFSEFHRLSEDHHYKTLPADWCVVISDIRGSTKAIESGRYQDVNTLGAASIAAVQSLFPGRELAYVFGGDGASFLVPETSLARIREALTRLQVFARANFGMDLRIGSVNMKEIVSRDQIVEVAKFQLAKGKTIALMRGGGLSYAENLIKSAPEKYCWRSEEAAPSVGLSGLSCRWQPLPSRHGAVLSILIKPVPGDSRVLQEILDRFERIFEAGLTGANPVDLKKAKYKGLRQVLQDEAQLAPALLSAEFIRRLISILVSVWAFKWRAPVPFDAAGYTAQIPGHSDYRKFDDMLRLILDCSFSQIDQITNYLQTLHAEKRIYFGLHQSGHALMTCLVESLNEGGHIHFIDGGDGGYAIAAKHLKDQLAKA
jgi:hypothetical protein